MRTARATSITCATVASITLLHTVALSPTLCCGASPGLLNSLFIPFVDQPFSLEIFSIVGEAVIAALAECWARKWKGEIGNHQPLLRRGPPNMAPPIQEMVAENPTKPLLPVPGSGIDQEELDAAFYGLSIQGPPSHSGNAR